MCIRDRFYGTQWWLIREDNTKPKAPVATEIPTKYIVRCVTDNSGHKAEHMDLLPDTFTIGEVTKKDDSYICPITISTEKYAADYSTVVNKKHSAVKENITFNMTWNGKAWEAPVMTQPVSYTHLDVYKRQQNKDSVATNVRSWFSV